MLLCGGAMDEVWVESCTGYGVCICQVEQGDGWQVCRWLRKVCRENEPSLLRGEM